MWHQPCQRCKYTTSVDIQKMRYRKLVTHVESHVSEVSARERRMALYKIDQQQKGVGRGVDGGGGGGSGGGLYSRERLEVIKKNIQFQCTQGLWWWWQWWWW